MSQDLWKYCTKEHCREFLLSLGLTGGLCRTDEKRLALLYGLANHPEDHYSVHRIPKQNGGFRKITEPDFPLKTVQKNILHHILEHLTVSDCACAYRKGISLTANASPHVGKARILKMDIKDFFGNITYISVYQHAFPGALFPPPVRTLLASLCCCNDVLPQGAPTSPYISNLVMKSFDDYMKEWCTPRGITYTRYCDDLTFSGDFDAREVYHKAASFLSRLGFEVNPAKTRICTRGSRQEVTGLTVNDKLAVSKEYRRQLRQEWYYITRYGLKEHLIRTGRRSEEALHYLNSLAGRTAHVLLADPDSPYFRRMSREIKELANSLQNS